MMDVQKLIDLLGLEALHGEGGLYRQSYRSADVLPLGALPDRYRSAKPAGTAIYYLLTGEPDSFSAFHRLPTDEVYHFYLGDPVRLTLLDPTGGLDVVTLGQDLFGGERVQYAVPAGVWQGLRLAPGGAYALMGTTMAPGYTDEDFDLANRKDLLTRFPQHGEIIEKLTRK
jgi:predicted cupin superfamily sugar epimerase